jgi:hypothetical protein
MPRLQFAVFAVFGLLLGAGSADAGAAGKDPDCVRECGFNLDFCTRAVDGLISSCQDECILPGCKTECAANYADSQERCLSENSSCLSACAERADTEAGEPTGEH